MQSLYATGNESKICNMKHRLLGYNVEIITPKDMGIHPEIEKFGRIPIENAQLNARTIL